MAVNPPGGAPMPQADRPGCLDLPGTRPGSRYAVISPGRIKVSESSCLYTRRALLLNPAPTSGST